MQVNSEINALFSLLDDPDEEVYSTVSERIVTIGNVILPNLENLWEETSNAATQERIETLIHRLHFTDLKNDFIDWRDSAYHDLLFGALLVAKFQYPDLHTTQVLQEIEKIRRNIWLELNSFLTPLEQANVMTSILYNYYNLQGVEVSYQNPDEFFINKLLINKKGNSINNSIFYQIMCELLEINARIINIPGQMVVAFYHSDYDHSPIMGHPQENIHFYVDCTTGNAHSHQDMEAYLARIGVASAAFHFKPLPHIKIIQLLLTEVSKCFRLPSNQYKQNEIETIISLLAA